MYLFLSKKLNPLFLKLKSGAMMYLPQLIFGFTSPAILLSFEGYEQSLNYFYIVIFGISALSSGFTNSLQYVERKFNNRIKTHSLVNSYIYSRLVFLPIVVYAIFNDIFIFDNYYAWDLILLLIVSSLPGWQFLYFLGHNKIPILISGIENFLKLIIVYLSCVNNFELYYIAVIPSTINIVITLFYLNKFGFRKLNLYEFLKLYLPFVGGGALFSISWLIFMNSVLNDSVSYRTTLFVYLERTLRAFERFSSVLSTVFLRGGANFKIKKNDTILVYISLFCVLISLYVLFWHGPFIAFMLISIFNVLYGHFLQQILSPNKLYNLGIVFQSLILLVTSFFTFDFDILALAFFIGGIINHTVRLVSIVGVNDIVSIKKASK